MCPQLPEHLTTVACGLQCQAHHEAQQQADAHAGEEANGSLRAVQRAGLVQLLQQRLLLLLLLFDQSQVRFQLVEPLRHAACAEQSPARR
jgi:hypothetical protein